MYRLIEVRHNPPITNDRVQEDRFQSEIRRLYGRLIALLSPLGEEGDLYGHSDYAVRPDLRDRPTVKAPPAPNVREFSVVILSRECYNTEFINVLHQFLSNEDNRYRIVISQDFDPEWFLTVFLVADEAQIYSSDAQEASRLNDNLTRL